MDKGRRILTMICTNCSCHNDINCVNLKKLKTTLKEVLKSGHLHFLPRDAMCSRCLLSPGVCPSLRLSVTLVHCIHTAEDIAKILIRPSSPIILVFDPPAPTPNSKDNHIGDGVKYTGPGVAKISDFQQKSPFISETVRDRPMVAMER